MCHQWNICIRCIVFWCSRFSYWSPEGVMGNIFRVICRIMSYIFWVICWIMSYILWSYHTSYVNFIFIADVFFFKNFILDQCLLRHVQLPVVFNLVLNKFGHLWPRQTFNIFVLQRRQTWAHNLLLQLSVASTSRRKVVGQNVVWCLAHLFYFCVVIVPLLYRGFGGLTTIKGVGSSRLILTLCDNS